MPPEFIWEGRPFSLCLIPYFLSNALEAFPDMSMGPSKRKKIANHRVMIQAISNVIKPPMHAVMLSY